MSGQSANALMNGHQLDSSYGKMSVLMVREDGVDQAKFKCPRKLVKGHDWDKLHRPALHVHGIWAHGFGFHFAVSDPDMPKGTNTNVEIMANMLESIYRKNGALPNTLVWIQDNTSRECKNSKIMKFAVMLKVLDVFRDIILGYPVKGHTHSPLDGTFGQCCVKIANSEFDTPMDVVNLLQGFLDTATFEHLANENKFAYKLDEAAHWEDWWNQIHLKMSDLTGPEAPHYFRICSRHDLTPNELQGTSTSWPGAPREHPDDIVMAVKSRLASISAHQVALICPAAEIQQLRATVKLQPNGLFPRKEFTQANRVKVVRSAESVFESGSLNEEAFTFLKEWAMGTQRRKPRCSTYTFLEHRASGNTACQAISHQPDPPTAPRQITVFRDGSLSKAVGHVMSAEEEARQDAEPPYHLADD